MPGRMVLQVRWWGGVPPTVCNSLCRAGVGAGATRGLWRVGKGGCGGGGKVLLGSARTALFFAQHIDLSPSADPGSAKALQNACFA